MRRITALLVLLASVVFVDFSVAGVKVIRGYAPGEFAVKGPIETQINELVNEIRNNSAQKPNMHLQIFVEGFADKTGFSAENDRLAKERADGIAAALSREFSKAKINFVSRGDTIDRRQVIVEWEYVSIPVMPATTAPVIPQAEKPAKKTSRAFDLSIMVLTSSFVVLLLFLGYYYMKSKTPKNKEPKSATRWLEVRIVGEKYSVEVEFKNGQFISPFRSRNGSKITRDNLKGIVDSLKGCLSKEEFMRQGQELLYIGKIKK